VSLNACAELVERGDPDRFRAVLAAPVAARGPLLVLYAFNLEVARAPWVTQEPLIAEMRLQWWRDVLANAASGAAKAHEVAGPLHDLILARGLDVAALDALVAARRWDIWKDPFEGNGLRDYLEDTGGGLAWVAAQALGADAGQKPGLLAFGRATALAGFLCAVPELESRGRQPLAGMDDAGIAHLAEHGLEWLDEARKAALPKAISPALLAGWQSRGLLTMAQKEPQRVRAGALDLSEFRKRGALLWQALTGRF
jgi:phytoene synthase